MRLFTHPFSSNARRARLVAAHLGLELDLVPVDLAKPRTDEHLRLNASGRVPVLDDGGYALTESRAIAIYLAEKVPGQTLYPADAKERAQVNRWLFWDGQHFAPAVGVLNREHFVKRFLGQEPDPVEIKRGEALFSAAAGELESHLQGRTWLAGDRLTLADLSVAATLMSHATARLDMAAFPGVRAWFGRIQELEAWSKTEPPKMG